MSAIKPEFSRPLAVEATKGLDATHHFRATDAERSALAKRLGIKSLDSLAAEVRLGSVQNGALIRLGADFTADVIQACVISLEPVASRIEASFERLYDPSAAPAEAGEGGGGLDEELPEPLIGGILDLGEILAEELALELNPFPRAPGVDFHEFLPETGEPTEKKEKNPNAPFAALAKLVEDGD